MRISEVDSTRNDSLERTFPRGKVFFAWGMLLIYVGFISATLSVVPVWREALSRRFGDGVFTTITLGAAIVVLSVVLAVMIIHNREKRVFPYVALVVILLFMRYAMSRWITITSEQIHFVEYGLVGFLAYNALRYPLRGWGLIAAAVLLGYYLGMVDECIQGNLASRVGEQRDMFWNGVAVILGLAVVVFSLRPRWIRGQSGRRELNACLIVIALVLPLQGYFNVSIAQFGIRIEDEVRGVVFRSRLAPEELRAYDDHLDRFREHILPKVGPVRMAHLLPQVYDKIHEEAVVHLFRRGQYFLKGDYFVAAKENAILDGYFRQFVAGSEHDWSSEKVRQLQDTIGDSAATTYYSPVAGHLITKFNAVQMWVAISVLEMGIIICLCRGFRSSVGRRVSYSPE